MPDDEKYKRLDPDIGSVVPTFISSFLPVVCAALPLLALADSSSTTSTAGILPLYIGLQIRLSVKDGQVRGNALV
jgi:hypothetical protein